MKIYDLGPFRLDVANKTLTKAGAMVPLGLHAIGVLSSLIEHAPDVVPKARIIDAVWPNVVVEEGNLTTQIYTIRRVLSQAPGGDRWIETLSGRGYRYVGPIVERSPDRRIDDTKRSNLPEPLTTFIGRDRELVELKRVLTTKRLVTIQGMGGIGKTRLALQLGAEVVDAYRDGVWIAELESIRDPSLVPSAVAQALGLTERTGELPIKLLVTHLKSRQVLLIVDNCEHLLDGCAQVADALLRAAKDVTIVTTSREPLRVAGEQIYALQSLSLPEAGSKVETMRQSEAVQLFVERIQLQLPDFKLTPNRAPAIAEICVRLDGIPLGLELAAARAKSLSVEQINSRLSDRFRLLIAGSRTALARQQTLRGTLDWSYDLLGEDERVVLRRLSIFPGSFTLEAAGKVASDTAIDELAIVDIISQLVSRSLVIADTNVAGTRYRLLETVRAYLVEKLGETGETADRLHRHAQFYRQLFAGEAADWLRMPNPEWRVRYLPELLNVRAALDWALGPGSEITVAADLAGASGPLWATLGLFGEGVQQLEAAQERSGSHTTKLALARLLMWLGRLLDETPARARPVLERAVDLYRVVDDPTGLGLALTRLGRVLALMGNLDGSEAALTEARPLLERAGPNALNYYHFNLGFLKNYTGDLVAARKHYERALELSRDARDDLGILGTTGNLANVTWALGDLDAAVTSYRELLALMRTSPASTRRLLGFGLMNLAELLLAKNQLDESLANAREGLPMVKADGSAWLFSDYGALRAGMEGKLRKASILAGYADHAHATNGGIRSVVTSRARERLRAELRMNLPAGELDRLLAEGAQMNEEEACRRALEE